MKNVSCGFLHCDPNKQEGAESVFPPQCAFFLIFAYAVLKVHQNAPRSNGKKNANGVGGYEIVEPCFDTMEEFTVLVQDITKSSSRCEDVNEHSDFGSISLPREYLLKEFCN